MLRWLEAARYKTVLALANFDGHTKPQSNLAQYIEHTRDKQVYSAAVLPCVEPMFITNDFSGPGRAMCPLSVCMCVCVCSDSNFLTK